MSRHRKLRPTLFPVVSGSAPTFYSKHVLLTVLRSFVSTNPANTHASPSTSCVFNVASFCLWIRSYLLFKACKYQPCLQILLQHIHLLISKSSTPSSSCMFKLSTSSTNLISAINLDNLQPSQYLIQWYFFVHQCGSSIILK